MYSYVKYSGDPFSSEMLFLVVVSFSFVSVGRVISPEGWDCCL